MISSRDRLNLRATYLLPEHELRSAGLSSRKATAIANFGEQFCSKPERFEAWAFASYEDLRDDVSKIWGLSDWSAAILALFHFGHADVWPAADGSLQRAVRMINDKQQGQTEPPGDVSLARARTSFCRS